MYRCILLLRRIVVQTRSVLNMNAFILMLNCPLSVNHNLVSAGEWMGWMLASRVFCGQTALIIKYLGKALHWWTVWLGMWRRGSQGDQTETDRKERIMRSNSAEYVSERSEGGKKRDRNVVKIKNKDEARKAQVKTEVADTPACILNMLRSGWCWLFENPLINTGT